MLDEIEKLDSGRHISTTRKLLIRPRHIARQTLKDRKERLEEAHDLFAVNDVVLKKLMVHLNMLQTNYNSPPNYLVFVIDDVVTTGSTMKEAISTLRNAGLVNTYGLALAH